MYLTSLSINEYYTMCLLKPCLAAIENGSPYGFILKKVEGDWSVIEIAWNAKEVQAEDIFADTEDGIEWLNSLSVCYDRLPAYAKDSLALMRQAHFWVEHFDLRRMQLMRLADRWVLMFLNGDLIDVITVPEVGEQTFPIPMKRWLAQVG